MKKVTKKIKEDNEKAARISVLEDLFYDFNRSRVEVFKMNFIRGIFFGFGSILGGTVLITLIVWILGFFVSIPGIGAPIEQVQDSIRSGQDR